MKEKERLLSLDEPLKFIFSHSALREEEKQKIRCGRKHFEELDGVEFFGPVRTVAEIRL